MQQNIINEFKKLIDSFLNSTEQKLDISNFDFSKLDIKEIVEKFDGIYIKSYAMKLGHPTKTETNKKFYVIEGYNINEDDNKIWLGKII